MVALLQVLILDVLITVDNLCKSYRNGTIKAVDGASFTVSQGEIFGLIGPNGAGKTTILGCLLALIQPTSGKVLIDGRSPYDLAVKPLIGFLPERPCYNRWMTIEQFLKYQHRLAKRPEGELSQAIKEVLALVELDVDPKKRRIRELSRGMLQRIGLAQALIGKPQVCFLDEPTSGMDPLGFVLIRKLLLKCKAEGITVVLNSHHLQEVEKVCDRIAFIRRGKIESVQSVESLAQLSQVLVVEWQSSTVEVDGATLEKIARQAGSNLIDINGNSARFAAPDKDVAADLIVALTSSGVKVYQATFEKRELVEMFYEGMN